MASDVATSLPQLTLREGTTLQVDAGAGNTVTKLVIHGFMVVPSDDQAGGTILLPKAPR